MTVVWLALAVLLLLLVCRVPVAFALLASGALGLLVLQGVDYTDGTLGRLPYQTPARYVLIVIPLFIAMGVFVKHGTLADDAFAAAKPVLRKLPGGLALVTIATCAGFAAISGSSVATVAAVGPTAIREMKRDGYDTAFAAGVVGSAGTLGVMIPPSIALVLYGIVSGESIGLLLIAGIVPGVLTALAFAVAVVVMALVRPEVAGRAKARATEWLESPVPETQEHGQQPASVSMAADTLKSSPKNDATVVMPPNSPPALDDGYSPDNEQQNYRSAAVRVLSLARVGLLFVAVMGGIYSGLMTASQAAAVGALLALGFLLWDAWRARPGVWATLRDAIAEAVSLSSMVFALLIGSAIFSLFIVVAGVPRQFAVWVTGLEMAPWMIVAMILLALLPLGMFLDPISMLLIAVPLTYPVVIELGYEGIWFGILIVKMVELALMTPPVGLNPYVVAGSAPGVTVGEAFRGITLFFFVDLLVIAVLFAFPALVMWLPGLSSGGG